jgi:acylphosphatase
MPDDERAVLARVTGRVQGVSFRVWVREEARALGLDGWVRNEADGSVRALLVGPATQVARMLEALRHGPPAASVAEVSAEPAAPDQRPSGFRIIP